MFKITFWGEPKQYFETREETRAEVLRILHEEAYPGIAAFPAIKADLKKYEDNPDLGIKEV